ncbi:uncharacterized protein LOC120219358 [Hibiscus syriacus]|uniref:uncharacterized protein LOC120219358 n=1 Tax=Hibiscus syriacus TaxID=106335 RepID=UPI001920B2F2|nr:uncharacterized protein LOC120219358 [Hibiscus syriacus]
MRSWNLSVILLFFSLPFFLLASPSASSIGYQQERIQHRVLMSFKEFLKKVTILSIALPLVLAFLAFTLRRVTKNIDVVRLDIVSLSNVLNLMMVRRLKINKKSKRIGLILKSQSSMGSQENLMIHPHRRVGDEPTSPIEAVYLQLMKRSYQYSVLRELFLAYCSLVVQSYS